MAKAVREEKAPTKLDLDSVLFMELFPEGEITEIKESLVPKVVLDIFERKSGELISKEKYRPGNFEHYFIIKHSSGDRTYLAQQTKTYDTNKDTERLTYFVDMRGEEIVGRSELRSNISHPDPYFIDKPFVGNTRTEERFRKQGLGRRRLLAMNAYSEAMYRLPLYSDTLNRETSIWEVLVQEGLARKFKEGKNMRYCFADKG